MTRKKPAPRPDCSHLAIAVVLSLALSLLVVTSTGSYAASLVPHIANAGFEDASFAGWGWYSRAKASYHSDTSSPHSGKRCVVFTNESPLMPEVYGRMHQGVSVIPGLDYELTAWVRGEDVAPGIHFTDWNSYQLDIPEGTYDWQKISVRFRTKNDQHGLNLGINVVNKCRALAVDDMALRPIGTPLKGDQDYGSVIAPGRVTGDKAQAALCVVLEPAAGDASMIEATVRAGQKRLLDKRVSLKPGQDSVEWKWDSGTVKDKELVCEVRLLDGSGKVLATATRTVEKFGAAISDDINKIEARLPDLRRLLNDCVAKSIPVDYPRAAETLLRQFIPLIREDVQKGEMQRAMFALKDLNTALDRATTQLIECLKEPSLAPVVTRYQTSPRSRKGSGLAINRMSFIANRRDSRGRESRGPVFFNGYGHFFQVRRDLGKFPSYGVNIIQVEVGPAITMPAENEISLKAAREIAKLLDQAAERNVMVNVLLSPHYFPQWALNNWPHLMHAGGGFIGYCVDEPEAKQVIEKFLSAVVPLLRGKAALHSFCLSNEPLFDRAAGCPRTRTMFADYLMRVHGSVDAMNRAYGTTCTACADVPIPPNDAYSTPQFYDYCLFNQERFSAWHKWMADVIHDMAPDIPVHAKIMSMALPWRHTVAWGVDPEQFADLSQVNGNDCPMWPVPDPDPKGTWAISWHTQNMSYDLQRSLALKPIFNSENHLVPDRSTYYVRPEHFTTALWQGAVHGQGATTIWVWERTYDHGYDFYGSVMERPGCALAVGTTNLNLNRFAAEVTALQDEPAPVAILFSMASIARDDNYLPMVQRLYEALNFCGVKVDFISERQMRQGEGILYKMLVFPDSRHVERQTFDIVRNMPSKTVIVMTPESLTRDPYGRPFPSAICTVLRDRALIVDVKATDTRQLWQVVHARLQDIGATPEISVVSASDGKPAWGVEWLTSKCQGRSVMNLVNLWSKPIDVRILRRGAEVHARNLLSPGGRAPVRHLEPLVPVLAQVE